MAKSVKDRPISHVAAPRDSMYRLQIAVNIPVTYSGAHPTVIAGRSLRTVDG